MEYDADCGGLDKGIARTVLTPGALTFLAELVHEFRDGVAAVRMCGVVWFGVMGVGVCVCVGVIDRTRERLTSHPTVHNTQLYKRRGEVQAQVEAGTYAFDFLPETARIREVCVDVWVGGWMDRLID